MKYPYGSLRNSMDAEAIRMAGTYEQGVLHGLERALAMIEVEEIEELRSLIKKHEEYLKEMEVEE